MTENDVRTFYENIYVQIIKDNSFKFSKIEKDLQRAYVL